MASIAFSGIRIDDLSRQIDDEKDRIDAVDGKVNAQAARITAVENTAATAQTSVRDTCVAVSIPNQFNFKTALKMTTGQSANKET